MEIEVKPWAEEKQEQKFQFIKIFQEIILQILFCPYQLWYIPKVSWQHLNANLICIYIIYFWGVGTSILKYISRAYHFIFIHLYSYAYGISNELKSSLAVNLFCPVCAWHLSISWEKAPARAQQDRNMNLLTWVVDELELS